MSVGFWDHSEVSKEYFLHPTVVVDQPFRNFQGGKEAYGITYRDSIIAAGVQVGPHCVIGRGAHLLENVVVDSQCIIEPNATIGKNCLIIYRAIIGAEASISEDCVIGGFISERSVIEPRCRVFGTLVHRQVDTTQPWDEHEDPEASTIICHDSFVGFGAILVGGIRVGPISYICAGATVTCDVPPKHVAYGVNRVVPVEHWKGQLSKNPGFH